VEIKHDGGLAKVVVDQKKKPPIDGQYKSLGTFVFQAGKSGCVTIRNTGADGHVIADTVVWVRVNN
jgi:hypothetical protein